MAVDRVAVDLAEVAGVEVAPAVVAGVEVAPAVAAAGGAADPEVDLVAEADLEVVSTHPAFFLAWIATATTNSIPMK